MRFLDPDCSLAPLTSGRDVTSGRLVTTVETTLVLLASSGEITSNRTTTIAVGVSVPIIVIFGLAVAFFVLRMKRKEGTELELKVTYSNYVTF